MRREQLVAQDVDHRTRHDLAIERRRDAHREERHSVEEVDGPVERVDDPLQTRAGLRGLALLAEDPGLRSRRSQMAPDELLARRSVCVTTSVGEDLCPTGSGRP